MLNHVFLFVLDRYQTYNITVSRHNNISNTFTKTAAVTLTIKGLACLLLSCVYFPNSHEFYKIFGTY